MKNWRSYIAALYKGLCQSLQHCGIERLGDEWAENKNWRAVVLFGK